MRKGALRSALTDALGSGKLAVVKELAFDEPKTREAIAVLEALDLRGRILVILPEPTEAGTVERSFRNLRTVKVAYAGGLGVYDLLRADRVLFTGGGLDALEARFAVEPAATAPEPGATTEEGSA